MTEVCERRWSLVCTQESVCRARCNFAPCSVFLGKKGGLNTMSIVLKNQVQACENSARELEEELIRDSRIACVAFDVRDLARSAVALFHDIGRDIEEWQRDMSNSPHSEALASFGNNWLELYTRLNGVFGKTAELIRRIEQVGPEVDGKPEFFKAWRELRAIVCLPQDRVAIAVEQSRQNEMRPLGEIVRELFHTAHD